MLKKGKVVDRFLLFNIHQPIKSLDRVFWAQLERLCLHPEKIAKCLRPVWTWWTRVVCQKDLMPGYTSTPLWPGSCGSYCIAYDNRWIPGEENQWPLVKMVRPLSATLYSKRNILQLPFSGLAEAFICVKDMGSFAVQRIQKSLDSTGKYPDVHRRKISAQTILWKWLRQRMFMESIASGYAGVGYFLAAQVINVLFSRKWTGAGTWELGPKEKKSYTTKDYLI